MTPTITETTYQTEIGPITAREHCRNLGVMHPNEHHLALAENELRAMAVKYQHRWQAPNGEIVTPSDMQDYVTYRCTCGDTLTVYPIKMEDA